MQLQGGVNFISLLDIALERYLDVCSVIESFATTRAVSDRKNKGALVADSYETKIQKAKPAIAGARNRSSAVPINSLPSEIFTRIFYLVRDSEPFCSDDICAGDLTESEIPKYLDFIPLVCSRW